MRSVNPKEEIKKIEQFIKSTLEQQNCSKVVLGISGGIDSVLCFYLLKKVISSENIILTHLYYQKPLIKNLDEIIIKTKIPPSNFYNFSIKGNVDKLSKLLNIKKKSNEDEIRLGNIMARIRMIILYDLAKKNKALVCGTENKSEYYLGYFTRFGDEASDFEPIRDLYKTQVYQLAEYLQVPKEIINQAPTAGLWKNQTDEKEFGFSYKEADQVLYLYYEKKLSLTKIKEKGLKNTESIINFAQKNSFKHHTPYLLNK